MQSAIWQRAQASTRRLVEVPLQTCLLAEESSVKLPTILRGVIDLAFEEPSGWVIVDYKTDAVPREGMNRLVEHYRGQVETYARAWQSITEQPVHETGLYFTAADQYAVIS